MPCTNRIQANIPKNVSKKTRKLYIEQEDGEIRTITIVESDSDLPTEFDSDRESKGFKEDAIENLKEVHETIRLYTRYAIGAFKNLGDAQVEELTLKFGLKIGGEAGIPILTKASAESNFEIQVKCKFPPNPTTNPTVTTMQPLP